MKLSALSFMLILTSSSCVSSPLKPTASVKSWNTVDPKTLNEKIEQAYSSGQAWARQPQLYVFNLFYFDELRKVSYDYEVDNTERPENLTIKIVRDGFLDDSVRGDIHQLQLNKNKAGQWRIRFIKKAHSCWRSEFADFSTAACP